MKTDRRRHAWGKRRKVRRAIPHSARQAHGFTSSRPQNQLRSINHITMLPTQRLRMPLGRYALLRTIQDRPLANGKSQNTAILLLRLPQPTWRSTLPRTTTVPFQKCDHGPVYSRLRGRSLYESHGEGKDNVGWQADGEQIHGRSRPSDRMISPTYPFRMHLRNRRIHRMRVL